MVYILEDDDNIRKLIKYSLTSQGFDVQDFSLPSDFWKELEKNKPHLILLDIMLPDIDGFEVVQTIRAKKISTPVLMLTAKDSVPDKVNGLNAGADDYMTKPFATEELIARIHALTRRSGEVIISELACADIALDLNSCDLKCKNASVHLSPKEFEVMRLLMNNSKSAVLKETLILNVWGSESGVEDNNLEAYISFLRRKLRYLNSTVTIKNIQKIGYRLLQEEG